MDQAAGEVVRLEAVEAAAHAPPSLVSIGSRSRYRAHGDAQPQRLWRMSQNEIVRFALNNCWLEEQGVPDLRAIWIVLHYGPQARV